MSDLITKTELVSWIDNWFSVHRYYHPYSKSELIPYSEIKDILDRMPSAGDVLVVRCENCRYYDEGMLGGSCGCCTHPDWKIKGHCHLVEKYGFCYRGKRRCEEMIEYGG